MKQQVTIGLFGLGTVGQGVVTILRAHPKYECTFLCYSRTPFKGGLIRTGSDITLVKAPEHILDNEAVDIVVEVMGGTDGLAWEVVEYAIQKGIPVVTANKALVHQNMDMIDKKLKTNRKAKIRFEAAVAGCVPILHTIARFHNYINDPIDELVGIINGSTAYLLDKMERSGQSMTDIVNEMTKMGYLEADPQLDLDGWDAMQKLCILGRVAFGVDIKDGCMRYGLPSLISDDFSFAQQEEAKIRLVATAKKTFSPDSSGSSPQIRFSVMPAFVSRKGMLGEHLEGATNFVGIHSKYAGWITLSGAGAGCLPTGHAVVADIVSLLDGSDTSQSVFPPLDDAVEVVDDSHQAHFDEGSFIVRVSDSTQFESLCESHKLSCYAIELNDKLSNSKFKYYSIEGPLATVLLCKPSDEDAVFRDLDF